MEIALLASLVNFVTNHAVKTVKMDVTNKLGVVMMVVYRVNLEISVTKHVMLNMHIVVIRDPQAVSKSLHLSIDAKF